MAPVSVDVPVLDTYQAVVSAYSDFLIVAIHTILCERNIYPQASFIKARKYNYPVRQSRHPKVCKWIQDAVAAVEVELLKCSVASTSLIIYSPAPACKPLERYVFSTASFPRIPAFDHHTPFTEPLSHHPDTDINNPNTNPSSNPPAAPAAAAAAPPTALPGPAPPQSNLPEQFRATLARLMTSLPRLRPLPVQNCTFTLAIELRDDPDVDAPIGREEDKAWIAAEPGWEPPPRAVAAAAGSSAEASGQDSGDVNGSRTGKTGEVGVNGRTGNGHGGAGVGIRGRYRGGVRTTPVRSVEAGPFQMEVWVEEGKAKFEATVEDGDGDGEG